jgi:hypothetical protein
MKRAKDCRDNHDRHLDQLSREFAGQARDPLTFVSSEEDLGSG